MPIVIKTIDEGSGTAPKKTAGTPDAVRGIRIIRRIVAEGTTRVIKRIVLEGV
jgi:hypothetical protein